MEHLTDQDSLAAPPAAGLSERHALLLPLAILLALGFWFAHLQWWWKANDDAVHQYFNAVKLSDPEATRALNGQALEAMIEARMEAKRIDRLELRVDVTHNWLLTSTSIQIFDQLLKPYLDPKIPESFSRHLFIAESLGVLLSFLIVLSVCLTALLLFFPRGFLVAFIGATCFIFLMALFRTLLSSDYLAILAYLAAAMFLAARLSRERHFPFIALAIAAFFVLGTIDHAIMFEVFNDGRDEIISPQGSLFDFLLYSLNTFLYSERCCSAFGFFARSNFNLLMILVFALRWTDRYAASYLLIAAASVIHVAQSGLAVFLLVGVDLLLRPAVLLNRKVAPCAALAALIFLTRQGAWPSTEWLSENATLIAGAALAFASLLAALVRYDSQLSRLPFLIGAPFKLRDRLRDQGPVVSDLVATSLVWLAFALAVLGMVKLLGREALDQMNYLTQLTIYGTPKRILAMLQPAIVFGLVLLAVSSWKAPTFKMRPGTARTTFKLACATALVIWTNNAVLALTGPFPGQKLDLILARHEKAIERPPFPGRNFSEANMYYLMGLYLRTGHYVPNGFFRPLDPVLGAERPADSQN